MLQNKRSVLDLEKKNEFIARHIGPNSTDQSEMLSYLGYDDMESLIKAVVPESIRMQSILNLPPVITERDALEQLKKLAVKNVIHKSFIGQGYYNTKTPNVILRNVLENPGWYTAYTPYQPEISQGRLEALLNFQTMVSDLTGMDIANASMLDEATAAAEAMALCKRMSKSKSNTFLVDQDCFEQTIDVLKTRAETMGIELLIANPFDEANTSEYFGVLLQYPGASGNVPNINSIVEAAHNQKALVAVSADILSLVMLKSPGEFGADVAVGSTQRFGVPLGFGGPHAAYMATRGAYKRSLPGRLVGTSIDKNGKLAYRLALQTREQHIRREKATSNICTSQVLLAVMASMYAVYHGPSGLKNIAERVHLLTSILAKGLSHLGVNILNQTWFDTLTLRVGNARELHELAKHHTINLRVIDERHVGVSLDELSNQQDVELLWSLFSKEQSIDFASIESQISYDLPAEVIRTSDILSFPAFNQYHSETEMLRYLRRLVDKDLALDRSMIPLGSCTMKLNATSEMIPVTWPEFSDIHPFAPLDQVEGYVKMIEELETMLCEITGYDAVSLQPNAGSQGEYAGLLAVKGFHESNGEGHRNICLIPTSAHGTNPASAQMCGMKVVPVKCDDNGNICIKDLSKKAEEVSENLAVIMVTYPSTHGVFEEHIREVAETVHSHGGQVYVDGANLNAMVGLCKPGEFGGDVSHLNLHKTFCIPHGGGGPGVGPTAVREHLAPFLPGHRSLSENFQSPVSAAAWGSASILPITWMYIKMMSNEGLRQATEVAILNANYIAKKLQPHFPVLYTGKKNLVAHECILDLRPIKEDSEITVDDVAKRLIDYGFHAPTMSFPVIGTLMVEPTESESKFEIDRFCDAMISIRDEIQKVEQGVYDRKDNPLINAPHTAEALTSDNWQHTYSRKKAAYPVHYLEETKYWVPVGRIDNVYGDKNLVCSCPSMLDYQ